MVIFSLKITIAIDGFAMVLQMRLSLQALP